MIGRKKESTFLTKGLSESGTLRCSLISGIKGIGKTTLLEHVSAGLLSNGSHILIPANGRECSNPGELLSQFTRNLFSSHNLDISDDLKTFARNMGKSLSGQIYEDKSTGSEGDSEVSDADIFIGELDSLFASTKQNPNCLTPVVAIDDIDFQRNAYVGYQMNLMKLSAARYGSKHADFYLPPQTLLVIM